MEHEIVIIFDSRMQYKCLPLFCSFFPHMPSLILCLSNYYFEYMYMMCPFNLFFTLLSPSLSLSLFTRIIFLICFLIFLFIQLHLLSTYDSYCLHHFLSLIIKRYINKCLINFTFGKTISNLKIQFRDHHFCFFLPNVNQFLVFPHLLKMRRKEFSLLNLF